jgi:hypothetical protein
MRSSVACATDVSDLLSETSSISARFAGTLPAAFGASSARAPAAHALVVPCAPSARALPPGRTQRTPPAHPTLANPRGALPVGPTTPAGRCPRHARRRHQHDQTCSQNETVQHGAPLLLVNRTIPGIKDALTTRMSSTHTNVTTRGTSQFPGAYMGGSGHFAQTPRPYTGTPDTPRAVWTVERSGRCFSQPNAAAPPTATSETPRRARMRGQTKRRYLS